MEQLLRVLISGVLLMLTYADRGSRQQSRVSFQLREAWRQQLRAAFRSLI